MTSRHVVVERFDDPDLLRLKPQHPDTPKPGEVLVRMHAAGVARADLLMQAGRYPRGPQPPFTPGWDVVGAVADAGSGTGSFIPGQPVIGLPLRGGHATLVPVPAERLIALPEQIDPVQAACLPLNYLTALQLLTRHATLSPGDPVVVFGASGGVGSALMDLSRLLGMTAIGVCAADKHESVTRFGGTPVDRDDLEQLHRAVQGTQGAAAVFDGIGGRHLSTAKRLLAPGGILVSYGFASGSGRGNGRRMLAQAATLALWSALPNRRRFSWHRTSHMAHQHPETLREDLRKLVGWLTEGRIAPIVGGTYPLRQAATAYRRLAAGGVVGKLVLTT